MDRLECAKIILEYLKTFMWPLVVCLFFLVHGQEIVDILSTRDVEAFGVKISGRLDDLVKNYQQEIEDLKNEIVDLNVVNKDKKQALISRIDAINTDVHQEIVSVREQIELPDLAVSAKDGLRVARAERLGFKAIVAGDIDSALSQFKAAEQLWPDYHNVAEIYDLLNEWKVRLKSKKEWAQLCQILVQEYSWGIPSDLRPAILEKSKLMGEPQS